MLLSPSRLYRPLLTTCVPSPPPLPNVTTPTPLCVSVLALINVPPPDRLCGELVRLFRTRRVLLVNVAPGATTMAPAFQRLLPLLPPPRPSGWLMTSLPVQSDVMVNPSRLPPLIRSYVGEVVNGAV